MKGLVAIKVNGQMSFTILCYLFPSNMWIRFIKKEKHVSMAFVNSVLIQRSQPVFTTAEITRDKPVVISIKNHLPLKANILLPKCSF